MSDERARPSEPASAAPYPRAEPAPPPQAGGDHALRGRHLGWARVVTGQTDAAGRAAASPPRAEAPGLTPPPVAPPVRGTPPAPAGTERDTAPMPPVRPRPAPAAPTAPVARAPSAPSRAAGPRPSRPPSRETEADRAGAMARLIAAIVACGLAWAIGLAIVVWVATFLLARGG